MIEKSVCKRQAYREWQRQAGIEGERKGDGGKEVLNSALGGRIEGES